MEEIDIIELLKRVKEGKAPEEIEVKGIKFDYDEDADIVQYLYYSLSGSLFNELITLDTKIKILDKPIIEELGTIIGDLENPSNNEIFILNWIRNNRIKINEIIKKINKEEK